MSWWTQPPVRGRRPSDVRWNVIAVLAVGIPVLAGCGASAGASPSNGLSGDPANQQAVTGALMRVGGPAPGSPVPLPGTITARAATGRSFTATAGRNGRFRLSLPPGAYRVTGRSPLIQSGQVACAAAA